MKFSVYIPPIADKQKVPVIFLPLYSASTCAVPSKGRAAHPAVFQVLYFLSGLTCDDQTFIVKSNAQRRAAEHGIALVVCDTSPRGLNISGEDEDWDFGTGAGFYLNATEPKWKQYRMYDYVVKELPEVLQRLSELDVKRVSLPLTPHSVLCLREACASLCNTTKRCSI